MAGQPSIWSGNCASGTQDDNATAYWPLAGRSNRHTTEAQAELPVRVAGSFGKFRVYVSANLNSGASCVFTLRKSGADAAPTVTYTASQTGVKTDNSNTTSYANTDKVCVKLATGSMAGTGNNITVETYMAEFTPDASATCLSLLVTNASPSAVSFSGASTSRYHTPLSALNNSATSETNVPLKFQGAATVSNLTAYVSANSRTTDVSFKTRKNSGAGGQTITYTAGQTGFKEDTSNSDSMSSGDTLDYEIVTSTGTESFSYFHISTSAVTTDGRCFVGAGTAAATRAFGLTQYWTPMAGISATASTYNTEANQEILPQSSFTAGNLQALASANGLNGNCVVTLRVNQADSALTVTYSSSQTGYKLYNSTTATVTGGTDELVYKVDTTAASSGTITMRCVSIDLLTSMDTTLTPSAAETTASAPSATVDNSLTVAPTAATQTTATSGATACFELPQSAASMAASAPDASVAHALTLTPTAASETTSAPSTTVSLFLTVSPSEATAAMAAPTVALDLPVLPSTVSLAISAPDVSVLAGDVYSPDAATAAIAPAGSVALAFGGTNRLVSSPPRFRATAADVTVAHGGISIVPDAADLATSAAASSVGHGDAVRQAGDAGVATEAPEVGLAFGEATRVPDAAVAAMTAPSPNLAIDSVLTPDPAIAGFAAASDPAVECGELVLTVATVATVATVEVISSALTLVIAVDAAGMAAEAVEAPAGLDYPIAHTAASVAIACDAVTVLGSRFILPDPCVATADAPAAAAAMGGLAVLPDPATLSIACVAPGAPYQVMSETTAAVVYCLVAYDCTVDCLVAATQVVACIVVPEDVVKTSQGPVPPLLPNEPV